MEVILYSRVFNVLCLNFHPWPFDFTVVEVIEICEEITAEDLTSFTLSLDLPFIVSFVLEYWNVDTKPFSLELPERVGASHWLRLLDIL